VRRSAPQGPAREKKLHTDPKINRRGCGYEALRLGYRFRHLVDKWSSGGAPADEVLDLVKILDPD